LAAPVETISRTRTSSMAAGGPSTVLVAESDTERGSQFWIPQTILARADEVIE